jgi:Uma2 family endonuclease
MVTSRDRLQLPTVEELPFLDDIPVDNELQNYIPNLLLDTLLRIWANRQDWFFGVDMAVFYDPDQPAIVPDGFLALGVPQRPSDTGRLSYAVWNEHNILPILALEVVSHKYNGEYEQKLQNYQDLGILYYVIYNSIRKGRQRARRLIEVYKLIDGKYQIQNHQTNSSIWMPEVGLGIGCETQNYANWERSWLFWYNQNSNRYLTADEIIDQERLEKEQERSQKLQERLEKEKLIAYLKSIGIDPTQIT